MRTLARGAVITAVVAQAMLGITACSDLMGPAQPIPTTSVVPHANYVARVIDGDTIELATGDRVRVLGIDTPELRPEQCGAQAAKAAAEQLLPAGSEVVLTADPTQANLDRYGRLLRYVATPDGRDLGAELLRQGLAKVYIYDGRPVQRIEAYQADESRAGADRLGIWGQLC